VEPVEPAKPVEPVEPVEPTEPEITVVSPSTNKPKADSEEVEEPNVYLPGILAIVKDTHDKVFNEIS